MKNVNKHNAEQASKHARVCKAHEQARSIAFRWSGSRATSALLRAISRHVCSPMMPSLDTNDVLVFIRCYIVHRLMSRAPPLGHWPVFKITHTGGLLGHLLHAWLPCPRAYMLSLERNPYIFCCSGCTMGNAPIVHPAMGTKFMIRALYNSRLSLEAHFEDATERRATELLFRLTQGNFYSPGLNQSSFNFFTVWFLDVQRRVQNSYRAQTPQ